MTAIDLCFGLHIKDMKDSFDFYFDFFTNHPIPLHSPYIENGG